MTVIDRRLFLGAGAAFASISPAHAQAASIERTEYGRVRGARESGVLSFKGVRYGVTDNVLKGYVKVTLTGEQRTGFHQYFHDLPADDKKKMIQRFLEFGNKNLTVNNVKTSDLNNREIPVVIEGDIDLSNYIITEDKEVYVGIDFFPEDLRWVIPDAKRQQDYALHSAYVSQDETELILPAGYKVVSMPAVLNEKYDDYEARGSYTARDNKVIFKKTLSFKTGRIRKADFENWKSFTKKLKDFNSNLILIKRP